MSAGYLVDERASVLKKYTLPTAAQVSPSGQVCGLSGVQTGISCDLRDADSFCNLVVNGLSPVTSGVLIIQVQISDDNTNWSDPTSGWLSGYTAAQSFSYYQSGGNLVLASGINGWVLQSGVDDNIQSGFSVAAGFQRTGRYVRALFNSGYYVGSLAVQFNSQRMVTGSGGGAAGSSGAIVVNV